MMKNQKSCLHQNECREISKVLRAQIGLQIATARLQHGWTLEEASRKMFDLHKYSFGVSAMERIELGKYDLKLWDMVMLSQLYNVPLNLTIK